MNTGTNEKAKSYIEELAKECVPSWHHVNDLERLKKVKEDFEELASSPQPRKEALSLMFLNEKKIVDLKYDFLSKRNEQSSVSICGLSPDVGHDKAVALLTDDDLVHWELERFNRKKATRDNHLNFFVEMADKDALPKNIDYFTSVYQYFSNVKENAGFDSLKSHYPTADNIVYISHHLAHVAHAYFSSAFDESLIISMDGTGHRNLVEMEFFTIMHGKGNKLEELYRSPSKLTPSNHNTTPPWISKPEVNKSFPLDEDIGVASLGRIYQLMTLWMGFHKFQEGSVMAMAAFGTPKYADKVRRLFKPSESDIYNLEEDDLKEFHWKIRRHKGPNRLNIKEDPFLFDVAASLQQVFEESLKNLIEKAISYNKDCRNLCFTGGASLNCLAMKKVVEWFPEYNIYIPPVPYDAGLSIGAAQYFKHVILDQPKNNKVLSPYLGNEYQKDEVDSAIEEWETLKHSAVDDARVVDLLSEGNTVAVYGGRSESGRRALGNRSILADPRNPDMKAKINNSIKHRQWFRPFAPSILREEVKNWFKEDRDSPYMGLILEFKEDKGQEVPAVNHLDNTARLQTVTKESNEWYYNFLKKWYNKNGVPILLNTSFNDREPICETPKHALRCFAKTDLDYLYFRDCGILVEKRK